MVYKYNNSRVGWLLEQLVPDENGCLPDNWEEIYEAIGDEVANEYDTLEDVCRAYMNVDCDIDGCKREIERLRKQKDMLEERQRRLKEFIVSRIPQDDEKKKSWKFGTFTVSRRKSPSKVVFAPNHPEQQIIDYLKLEDDGTFLRHKEEWSLNKDEIKRALKDDAGHWLNEGFGVTLENETSWSVK